MSKTSFIALCVLLSLSALGGLAIVMPRPTDLGVLPERSCAEWLAHPEASGPVRLTDCQVDARAPVYREDYHEGLIAETVVIVRPADWEPSFFVEDEPSALLVWHTDDPELRALTHRVRAVGDDDAAYARLLRRRAEEMTRARVVEGSAIEWATASSARDLVPLDERIPRDVFVLEDVGHASNFRGFGLVMLLFGVLGLGVVVTMQRRWRRAAAALRGGSTAPVRF